MHDGLPRRTAELLARRGVRDAAEAHDFLHPSPEQLHDPFLLYGMESAVDRLAAARGAAEKVAVVGDYDVDGVTATALLLAVFRVCGVAAEAILPHRMREGYGFQPLHVERAAERGCRLIVTVDCGTGSSAAVAAAAAAGIDVVVTDHHLPGGALPEAAVLVNPRQEGCNYPFGDLAGVGLALKLAQALAERCERPLELDALLRVACLGTIADLVPLVGENRVIASLGLEALAATRSPGLKALFEKAGARPPFSASDVGYRIGPRLNAAGRLDDAGRALDLLLCREEAEARRLAETLDSWNRERQAEEKKVVDEAREELASRSPLPPIAVAWREGWHRGVVGIAAGKLARELHRPTLLLAVEGDTATGSGRSIPGIALHAFLSRWEEHLERFGGHAQAVGLTAPVASLEALRRSWEEAAEEGWEEELFVRRYEVELALAPREANAALLEELSRLEPHGQGNPAPLVTVGPLELQGPPRLFGKGHLSALGRGEDGGAVRLLGWRWADRASRLAGRFEALGHLEADDYRGGTQLRLLDVRPA